MQIFGTDGVRGLAGSDLNAFVALKLGIAAGIYFKRFQITNKLLVGKDTRKSGYMIENALVSGLTSVGYDVIQVGPMPTPAVAFLTENMRCDGGLMISASHNPYEDNGVKFFDRFGFKLDEQAEREIEKIYANQSMLLEHFTTKKDIGYSKRIDDVVGRYIVHIKNSFPKDATLQGKRIVLDCANGAAYKVAPSIFEELGAEIIVLNDKPNGYNINDGCGAMHPNLIAKEVKRLRADIGFGLDGDADRIVVIDEFGNIVDGDKLLGALALYKKEACDLGNGIVATSMSNLALEQFLSKHKIDLKRCNVGDKYVLQAMQANNYNFGGEQSGHIIFSQYAKTGDGLVSALQVMALLLKSGKKASQILNPFELYPQKLFNLPVTKKIPLDKIPQLASLEEEIKAKKLRSLIRYSGTENKLRILLEGLDKSLVESYLEKLVVLLKKELS